MTSYSQTTCKNADISVDLSLKSLQASADYCKWAVESLEKSRVFDPNGLSNYRAKLELINKAKECLEVAFDIAR